MYDRKGAVKQTVDSFLQLLRHEFATEERSTAKGGTVDFLQIMDRLAVFSPQVIREARERFAP